MKSHTVKPFVLPKTKKLMESSKGIFLEVGCGVYKPKGAIGMDVRDIEGVDIVHDMNQFPWPIPDDSCKQIAARHVLEHIPKSGTPPQIDALAKLLIKKKVLTQREVDEHVGETHIFSYLMRFLEECWRVMVEDGQLLIVVPYAGSIGFNQDPTHASPISESLFFYFDPEHGSRLWSIYKPRPWKIDLNAWSVNGNLEVILSKRAWTEKYEKADYYK
jgi:hypothetical protein